MTTNKSKSWRDVLPVHPAADLCPRMTFGEFEPLVEDIEAYGLQSPIVLYQGQLLDGRHRLDALEQLGLIGFKGGRIEWTGRRSHDCWNLVQYLGDGSSPPDPYDLVLSLNLHRRHLTGEKKRELIAKQVKAKPQASNRQIAKQVKASHVTVGAVRSELESTGQIDQLEKTVGADGKARKKPRARKRAPEPINPDEAESRATESKVIDIEQRRAQMAALDQPVAGHHLAPDDEVEIADPAVIEDNLIYSIERINEHARVFKKLIKQSAFDREAQARIVTVIDGMIQKWRSVRAALTEKRAIENEAAADSSVH